MEKHIFPAQTRAFFQERPTRRRTVRASRRGETQRGSPRPARWTTRKFTLEETTASKRGSLSHATGAGIDRRFFAASCFVLPARGLEKRYVRQTTFSQLLLQFREMVVLGGCKHLNGWLSAKRRADR